ncbi:alpha-L-arabinofuranosidase C-terminal domain-containing protein [uncultured Acetatifactor sp.]|uniref:alpha-L-arabinofuranosidase C-terminal domain-containing protein n=1 Tax=uncultured Acetatifactor sp. TaxID=1671927 RepID=UPI0026322C9E|nr:alpha-L-arabinofuranosidase C-terminal domain-containing protein [uncultured Acetatifactor sp.]
MDNRIHIHTKKVRFRTAPELYGLFFEDINHAADGGLYPEMIRNRAFEDSLLPEGCSTDPKERIFVTEYGWPGAFNHGEGMDEWADLVAPTKVPGWYARGASFRILTEGTLNHNRKAALEVSFEPGGEIYNIGYFGVPVKAQEEYRFYFMARSDAPVRLTAAFVSAGGESLGGCTVQMQESGRYLRYDCDLTASGTDYDGRFRLSCDTECTVIFGFTSLMPKKTFKGHGLREDLALALKNTHAKFIRFPGGCVVEGINEANALRFSRTIGPVWERPGAQLMWHYRTTNGLGFHEYLQLCEDLEMEALYVCNCGMSCQARNGGGFSEELTKEYLGEALHALEYALGDEDTPYGRLRAQNGRKEPFRLKYVEIGNENFGPEYQVRYEMFYRALKEAFPQVIYISNGHTEREGLPTDYVDEHYYDAPEFFLEHTDLFDDYDRSGPKIFLGEYAVNGGNTIASMECALAEAAFLLGVERNQDIVRLTAYAPLFQNSDYTAWKPNMIVFDNHQVYGIPSYHAVSLLGKYRGEEVVEMENESGVKPPAYRGIPGIQCEKEGLLFRNPTVNGKPVEISRCVYGEAIKAGDAWEMVFGDKCHHFTGKSREWNEAFEAFIKDRGFPEKPVIWVTFGTEELEAYTFEIDVKAEADNPVTLSVWNHHPDTDAGCNEPKDTEWTTRTVRNQVWRIADGTGATRVPRFFDKPLSDEEKAPVSVQYGEYNHYKIACDAFGYECYLNGQLVQKKVHTLHPLVNAAAVQDRERIYLKLVNVDNEARDVRILADCAVKEEALAEVLAAPPESVNSFVCREHVAPRREIIRGGSDFWYRVPAHSVNVLILEKQDCH